MCRCAWPRTGWRSSASRKRRLRAVSIRNVILYHAEGCHLCERARAVVESVRLEVPFELDEIDIEGDPVLESRYRKWLPVVEIDGERAFVYYVDRAALRRKVAAQT